MLVSRSIWTPCAKRRCFISGCAVHLECPALPVPREIQGPWLPQPSANPVTTVDLGLILATAELLCPDLGRGIGIHCRSVLHWTECCRSLLLRGIGSQPAPRQLMWQYPAMPFIVPFTAEIYRCSTRSRLCSQKFATALDFVSVLQQGYKVGMPKGLCQASSPVLTWRGVCSSRGVGGRGQLPTGRAVPTRGAACAGVVQRRVVVAGHVESVCLPGWFQRCVLCPAQ